MTDPELSLRITRELAEVARAQSLILTDKTVAEETLLAAIRVAQSFCPSPDETNARVRDSGDLAAMTRKLKDELNLNGSDARTAMFRIDAKLKELAAMAAQRTDLHQYDR